MNIKATTSGVALALSIAAPVLAQTLTAWDAPVKVTASAGALTKSGGCEGCPDAGAHSTARLIGDGYAEFLPGADGRIMAGLSTDLSDATAAGTIDFAFSLWPNGTWEIRERGVYRTEGTGAAGDRLRVAVEAGRVVYRRNGLLLYRSAVPPSYPLALDVTLFSLGASLAQGAVVPASAPPPTVPSAPLVATVVGPYEAVVDRLPHAKPPVPVLEAAGSRVADPVFLSLITRVTDGATRPGALARSYRTASSPHQNAWSANGSRFWVVSSDGMVIPFAFDAAAGTAQRINPTNSGGGGLVLSFNIEPQFSYVRDPVVYGSYSGSGAIERTIDQYDFTTGTYSRLLEADALVPGLTGTYIGLVASSAGPTEWVMTMFGGSRQDLHHYVVLFEATNPSRRVMLDTSASTLDGSAAGATLNFRLHHAAIDRSGRYVMLYPASADQTGPRAAPQSVLWDTQANVFTEITASARPYGHDAYGYGVSVNQDCCTTSGYDAAQWQFRSLAAPLLTRDLIKAPLTPKEVHLADHSTWHNARPDTLTPFVSGLYRYGTTVTAWRAWDDEIVAVQTDAAAGAEATVWRFAHHRSDTSSDIDANRSEFWYQPRPNVSSDGRWVLFTSNWEKTLGTDPLGGAGTAARQDVFLVALKPAPPVTIGAAPLPAGRAKVAYSQALWARGGAGSYAWAITSGALPPGLTLAPVAGTISGTPTTAGSYSFTVTASDHSFTINASTATYAISISPAVKIASSRRLPTATLGEAYSYAVPVTHLQGTAAWSLSGGAMPPGMTLDPATGMISGTCVTAGLYYFNATVRDVSTSSTLTLGLEVK